VLEQEGIAGEEVVLVEEAVEEAGLGSH